MSDNDIKRHQGEAQFFVEQLSDEISLSLVSRVF